MALFGGIGKALGLGTSQGRGFITGLATKVSEEIDKDLAKTDENVSRLAELRASRAERDDATNRAAKAASKLELQDMVSQLGNDPDAAQSLIDQFGYSQAKTYAPLVAKTSMNTGKSPASIIGLTTRKGSSVTLDQLINHVTPIVDTSSSVGGTRGSVAVGFGKMFGGDEAAQKRYESQSDALIDAGGFRTPDEVLDTMPPALQNNLKPYVLGKLPDALKEAQRLTEISINLKAEGKEEEAAALKLEANTLTLISQMTKSKDDKLTVGEQNSYGKLLGTKLGSRYGIDGILGDDGLLVDKEVSQQIRSEYISLEAGLKNKIATYVNSSVNNGASKSGAYALADVAISKAIASNRGIELIISEDGPPRLELLDTPLSTILMNKDGTPPPASNEPNLGATVPPEATATEQTPITTGDSAVDSLTLDYGNATTDAQREAILDKLVLMGKRQVAQKLQGN
tara:strand:+ start:2404 stop:3771 length:1368 start_codon:yes stop_codon:yes gene_type:complete